MNSHEHHHQGEGDTGAATRRKLRRAVIITVGILVMEVIGAVWTGSLALLSDAAHVFLDVFALGLSLVALQLAVRPATETRTYGWHRAEVFAAFINGLTLLVVAGWIFHEAYQRLQEPREIKALGMLTVAAIGLVANAVVAWQLRGHHQRDLNLRSAFFHVVGDLLASVAVVTGGVFIYLWDLHWLDPVLGVLIALLILVGALRVTWESSHILLEGVPKGLKLRDLEEAIRSLPGVANIHHLHVWNICSNVVVLSSHVLVDRAAGYSYDQIIHAIQDRLRDRFQIEDVTLQLDEEEHEGDALVEALHHPVDSGLEE